MKKSLLFIIALFWIGMVANAQLFTDNFESGTTQWTLTGAWGLNSNQSTSPTHSLSESPTGNYSNNLNTYATMTTGVDLSTFPSASLTFNGTYRIEEGFDTMFVEVSTDNFATHVDVGFFSGNDALTSIPPFAPYTFDLGGFCGNANVKVRFHFYSDGGFVVDGMYIDDFTITGSSVDNSPPLIIHSAPQFYEGSLNNMVLTAQLIDFSGINTATSNLVYNVDGGADQIVSPVLISGNNYSFTIPTQTPGAYVSYHIFAEDSYITQNNITSATFAYIAGNHIIQDNGVVDFFSQFGPGAPVGSPLGTAVKISLGSTDLVGLLIRNYTDNSHPNDPMDVHIWNDVAGLPGTDVITPFSVVPAATLSNTSAMKWVDLRPYAANLTGLTGTYYIGFTVPTGVVNITITEPGSFSRSYVFDGTTWTLSQGTSGIADNHFRAITSLNQDVTGPNIVNNSVPIHAEASISAQVVNSTVTDMTGVASTDIHYKVDNGTTQTVAGTLVSGNNWTYNIPAQPAGAWVKYWISAVDLVNPIPYTNETDTFIYISGVYNKFDDNAPDVYTPVGTVVGNYARIAQMIDFGTQYADVRSLLIRNYYSTATPANTPNDPMTIHVWNDAAGLPGTDLITPFIQASAAGPTNPMGLTMIDLRPYSAQLSNLTGIVYPGYSVASGSCAVLALQLGTYIHTYTDDGSGTWVANGMDAQIRIVTTALTTGVSTNDLNNTIDVYPNPTSNLVNVFIDNFKNATLQIISINGQVVLNKNVDSQNTLLNVEDYNKGVYIVKITSESGVTTQKLVVQ